MPRLHVSALSLALLVVSSGAFAQSATGGIDTPAGPSSRAENLPAGEQAASGWDGTLPPLTTADDYGSSPGGYGNGYGLGGGDINIFIDNSIQLGRSQRHGALGYGRLQNGPCGSGARYDNRTVLRGGQGRTAGYISGGTFGSTVRCDDGYPGLPLRPSLEGYRR